MRRVSEFAALSSKEPFLVLHNGKVVLRPRASHLPQGNSSFYNSHDIILFPCPVLKHPKDFSLHCLDVVHDIFLGSSLLWAIEVLCCLPEGSHGHFCLLLDLLLGESDCSSFEPMVLKWGGGSKHRSSLLSFIL